MYLHLGADIITRHSDIIGIFDADNCTSSKVTKKFLKTCQDKGILENVELEIPKSFVLCKNKRKSTVYVTPASPGTLKGRIDRNSI